MADLISPSVLNLQGKSHFHCCVPLCYSDSRYDNTIHFHKIPKDVSLKKEWIVKIRRDEGEYFKINRTTVVCSKHFTREDYRSWTPVRKCLKKTAVPSVFDWSSNRPARRTLKRKILSDESPTIDGSHTMAADGQMELEQPLIATPLNITDEKEIITKLKEELQKIKEENKQLKYQFDVERFGTNRFSNDDSCISFYTGFPTYLSFITFFNVIQPSAKNMKSAYYEASETISLAGRKRGMQLVDEMFMFFCRLHAGLLEKDLSVRFNCSVPTVSRKIITWANFLYFILADIPIWLSRNTIQTLMPEEFKALYPRTRVVIDCTELRTQTPSSLVLNSQAFSNYKGTTTVKCLLGIAPHGSVTFVSTLFTGSMSDVEITKLSGLLELIEPGDDIMADKGFTLKKVLQEKGATLNIPDFLSNKRQFSVSEVENTEQIAGLRIHIERMNRRIKENHLFDTPIPLSLIGSINQLWTVACLTANFKGPLVKSWAS
ncbi:uncharacterized protein LOC132727870 [Ruditapes philippinarum]|uniref:uncharacterized protein LOC132727870 n=1 Tax=Ruditapes philippinarum TaxID=129788 RepID=UPI00295A6C3C|nr:uncharacterized protein LOC132727870 [Ruditapes philippinarum]